MPAIEILAHRVVWSVLLLALLVTARRRWREAGASFASAGRLLPLAATTALIGTNWLVFIWAVNSGRVLESSLGYFMNPLVNVLLGVLFLGERLSRWQLAAVGLAAAGVAVLMLGLGAFPWVPLTLATTFGLYGLVRKAASIEPVTGLLVETALLGPAALVFLGMRARAGGAAFGSSAAMSLLLASTGLVTVLPLLWFAHGIRRLRLATMGLLQYVAPTGQFALALALYHERFTPAHAAAFACIWTSLCLYSWDALRARR